jgi:hypothetical protein
MTDTARVVPRWVDVLIPLLLVVSLLIFAASLAVIYVVDEYGVPGTHDSSLLPPPQ